MTVSEALAILRMRVRDEAAAGYSDEALLDCLNAAARTRFEELAAAGDTRIAEELLVTEEMPVPARFLRFAGQVPVRIRSGRFRLYEGDEVEALCWISPEDLTAGGELPLGDENAEAILSLAAIRALNLHEFDVTQDLALDGRTASANRGAVTS